MTSEGEFDREVLEGAREVGPTGPCIDDERLADFYQGRLSGSGEEAIRAHLATCSDCLRAAREAERFVLALGGARPAASRAGSRRPLYAVAAAVAGIGLLAGLFHVATRTGGEGPTGSWATLAVSPAPYVADADELVWRGGGRDEEAPTLDVAAARYRAGDYEGAVADLASYVASHPDDPRGRFYLGVARLLSGSHSLAADELQRARALPNAPEDATWYLALAWIKAGELARARTELERVATSEGERRGEARALLRRLDGETRR